MLNPSDIISYRASLGGPALFGAGMIMASAPLGAGASREIKHNSFLEYNLSELYILRSSVETQPYTRVTHGIQYFLAHVGFRGLDVVKENFTFSNP